VANAYEARDLVKRHGGAVVLDVPHLAIPEGCFCGLLGPNGAGKTTLIEILAGLESPDAGRVWFRGRPLPPAPRAARSLAGKVACVLQPAVLFRGSVVANVEYGLRVLGLERAERRHRAMAALERLGLKDLASRHARELSRGEAQRVAIARALVLGTDVLLLDEPLTAVDRASRQRVVDILRELKQEGRTVVLAAHEADLVLALADQLLVMRGGHLHQQELANVLSGVVGMSNGVASFRSQGGLALEVIADHAGPARVVADPAAIILSREPIASSARNCCRAVVRGIAVNGPTTIVRLDAGEPLVAHITTATQRQMGLSPGDVVYATIKTSALRVLG